MCRLRFTHVLSIGWVFGTLHLGLQRISPPCTMFVDLSSTYMSPPGMRGRKMTSPCTRETATQHVHFHTEQMESSRTECFGY
ncbi:hypothetical protein TRIATDRAFT_296845 [Trichoderma atroviride IMI 206040]|uniref:Secreted protein n=1 Tax=Hypocrea atroviridis (strain ATCC 20476 / IMI 206040) TaxID=452589 RepID=G9NE57_HYPAI|nr:uncharacterized protein TRIATDRAFT_296845 [Trichoderma atroviride IMI 206040]EHK50963.1 hypothetical protein TRIATDRAFT_296845 [Trichoderma atroviride IMI 206040]